MHECLQIPEVVDLIIEDVFQSIDEIDFEVHPMISTALTCKAFLDPSLDRLWRELTDFRQIVSCLPKDVFLRDVRHVEWDDADEGELPFVTLNLRRSITPKDLERYLKIYAHRIREFRLSVPDDGEFVWFSVEAFQALQSATRYKAGALCPHVRKAQGGWVPGIVSKEDRSQCFPFISLFLGPEVGSFDLHFNSESLGSLEKTTIQSALQNLVYLRKVSIIDLADIGESSVPNELVANSPWKYLQDIYVNASISASGLAHLSSLSSIRKLNCRFDSSCGTIRWRKTDTRFPSLEFLHAQSQDFEPIVQILQTIPQPSPLNFLTLSASQSSPSQVNALVKAMPAHRRLAAVHIASNLDGSRSWNVPAADGHRDFTVDLSPLIESFPTIRQFYLDVGVDNIALPLPPDLARQISSSCPNLVTLHIGGGSPYTPRIDQTDLISIVQGCPSLAILQVGFDASGTTSIEASEEPLIDRELSILFDSNSPITSPEHVLAYFQGHFSKKVDMLTAAPENSTSDEGEEVDDTINSVYARNWEIVVYDWTIYQLTR